MKTKSVRVTCRFVLIAMLAACGGNDDGGASLPDAPSSAGTSTRFTWTIRRQGAVATCAAVGADEVHITATPENGLRIDHRFQCVLVPGMLSLPAGRYAITAKLYDGNNQQTRASASAQAVTVPASGTPPTVMFGFVL